MISNKIPITTKLIPMNELLFLADVKSLVVELPGSGIMILLAIYRTNMVVNELIAKMTYKILNIIGFTLKYSPIPPKAPEKTLLVLERVSFLIIISPLSS